MDDNLVLRALMGAAGASVLAEIDLEKQRQEAEDLRKDRDAARAEIETLREQLADAQRAVSDAFAEVNSVREQLDAARSETVETRKRLNDETDRHNKTNAEKVDLFQKLEWANKHNAELVKERDAARAAVSLQRAGIERLNKFVWKVRWADCYIKTLDALAELDASTPVAEPAPCPECERLHTFAENVRNADCYADVLQALAELDACTEPTPVAEPIDAEGGA